MLKVYDYALTMSEFPDEIAVCINISNCPGMCANCSEPWLLKDIGEELTEAKIQSIIDEHSDCTLFGIMGGDADHEDIKRIADYVHKHSSMKVGMYSGRDYIDIELIPYLDIYKIGRWITPGKEKNINCGPLVWPTSNQLYFEKENGKLVNATHKFRRHPISDWNKFIINDSKEED